MRREIKLISLEEALIVTIWFKQERILIASQIKKITSEKTNKYQRDENLCKIQILLIPKGFATILLLLKLENNVVRFESYVIYCVLIQLRQEPDFFYEKS